MVQFYLYDFKIRVQMMSELKRCLQGV